MSSYDTGSAVSADGTVIGYRRLGRGPAVILLHGGMQAAQHYMKLRPPPPRHAESAYPENLRGPQHWAYHSGCGKPA